MVGSKKDSRCVENLKKEIEQLKEELRDEKTKTNEKEHEKEESRTKYVNLWKETEELREKYDKLQKKKESVERSKTDYERQKRKIKALQEECNFLAISSYGIDSQKKRKACNDKGTKKIKDTNRQKKIVWHRLTLLFFHNVKKKTKERYGLNDDDLQFCKKQGTKFMKRFKCFNATTFDIYGGYNMIVKRNGWEENPGKQRGLRVKNMIDCIRDTTTAQRSRYAMKITKCMKGENKNV